MATDKNDRQVRLGLMTTEWKYTSVSVAELREKTKTKALSCQICSLVRLMQKCLFEVTWQELSYRKQIARQLHKH